jgi:hypothetical protein
MKKYISMMLLALSFGFVSCDVETNEDAGGTNVEKMAGHWTVTFYKSGTHMDLTTKTGAALDTLTDWSAASSKVSIYTFNTADNLNNIMWFSDYPAKSSDYSFWQYKIKVNVNYGAETFSCDTIANTSYDGCNITVVGGKILPGAATTPRGAKADSIVAYVQFSDDSAPIVYKMSGYRYTGFSADN